MTDDASYLGDEYKGLVTQFDDPDAELVLVQFGFQSTDAATADEARAGLRPLLDGDFAPVNVEGARYTDPQGYEQRMYLLYWKVESEYLGWWGRADVQAWWASLPTDAGAPGVWKETMSTPAGRHDYATGVTHAAGPSHFMKLAPSPHFGFAGAYRARLADSSFDGLGNDIEKLQDPTPADSIAKRVQVELPENICYIREGQTWDQCSAEELAIWEEQMNPVVDDWVGELRDEPVANGCISIRDSIEQDIDGNDVERRSQFAFLLSLDHIEQAARRNPKHIQLMKTFGHMYATADFEPQMNIWVEVHVPKQGRLTAEYVNCHGMTGFLPFFPSHAVALQSRCSRPDPTSHPRKDLIVTMEKRYPQYKAAAVQAAPVFLDLGASVEKAVALIGEAASNGAKLVGFPEGFLPGFAGWVHMITPGAGTRLYEKLHANAVEIPSPAVQAIAAAARENEIYVCMSVNERDGGTLYVTQLWFSPKGELIGKHRKIRQSHAERMIWGEGDGSTMTVFPTELGNRGGLECWEQINPVNITAMNSMNEQVHVASWPSFFPGQGIKGPTSGTLGSQYYAIATQTFVIAASSIYTKEALDIIGLEATDPDTYHELIAFGGGISRIIGPDGTVLTEPLPTNEEGIVYADIDLADIIPIKYWIDPAGHYGSKPLRVLFDQTPLPPVQRRGTGSQQALAFEQLDAGVTSGAFA